MYPGMRKIVRRLLTGFLVLVVLAIFVAVVGEFFIEVARDKGWYTDAGDKWDRLVSAVLEFVTSPIAVAGIALLAGTVGGLWLDQFLLRRERIEGAPPTSDVDESHQQLIGAINEAHKSIGYALGADGPLSYSLAVTSVEPLLLMLERELQLAVPDLHAGDAEEGTRRALLFLNYVTPVLQLKDFKAARERANLITPQLMGLDIEDLREATRY